MSKIPDNQLCHIKNLYYIRKMHMAEIAKKLRVSIDSVVYFMRKHKLERRSGSEVNILNYKRKPLSFVYTTPRTIDEKLKECSGVMLYLAEGYKTDKSSGVDFANSDPVLILIFLNFLRKSFKIDEKRIHILLYCHNQDTNELISFWSKVTKIPRDQFSRPYVKASSSKSKREMKYGLVHIRYYDKRLLSELKKLIESYKLKYAPVV